MIPPAPQQIVDRYAIELAKHPDDRLRAALIACKDDMALALELMAQTAMDDGFEARQRELVEASGAKVYIPSKELVTLEILNIARKPDNQPDLRLRAYRLAAEIAGYMPKGDGTNININNGIVNRVMQAPLFGDADDWEKVAAKQQRELIDVAYAVKQ